MRKRMFLMLAVVVVFLAIIGSVKYFQIRSAMAQGGGYQPPPEAVTTTVAKQEMWETTINAIGTVVAVNGVNVSADLPGLVEQISFESGRHARKLQLRLRRGELRALLLRIQPHPHIVFAHVTRENPPADEEQGCRCG